MGSRAFTEKQVYEMCQKAIKVYLFQSNLPLLIYRRRVIVTSTRYGLRCKTTYLFQSYGKEQATGYGNEQQVGDAIRDSGIPRNEFYITTKLA
jgi:hypothetical protein